MGSGLLKRGFSDKSLKTRRSLQARSITAAIKNVNTAVFEEEEEEENVEFLLDPLGNGYRAWWYFTTLCSFLTGFFTPWEVAFQDEPGLRPYKDGPAVVEFILSLVFLIDIGVQFFVPHIRMDGLVEKRRRRVMMHYFRTWFFVDLVGIIPFGTIVAESMSITDDTYLRSLALLRLFRLVRARRIFRFFRDFETNIRLSLVVTTLLRNLTIVVLVGHFAGCMFYFISRWYEFDDDTWIGATLEEDFANKTELEKYIYTFYFSITTMTTVGYGDFSPKNTAEVVFGTCYMIFNILLNSYILGTITLIVIKADEQTGTLRALFDKLNSFAFLNRLQEPLRKLLKEHIRFTFENPSIQDKDVLDGLPMGVKRTVLRSLYLPVLSNLHLFKGTSPGFLMKLVEDCKVDVYIPDQTIIADGDVMHELHVMMAGVAHQYIEMEANGDEEKVGEIGESKLFAMESFFTLQEVSYSVRSRTICRVLVLTRDVFETACKMFPRDHKLVERNLASNRIPTNSSVTSLSSFGVPPMSGSDSEDNAPSGVTTNQTPPHSLHHHPTQQHFSSPFADENLNTRLSRNNSATTHPTPPLPTIVSEE
ncbi:hypothetical protein BSKO_03463 [Bryopsis sp. KO-2023]|nr:hypothetical protein BSKO_03463 [Bryopsis sp. KO-2023]